MLHAARRRPEALVIGIDTAAEAMRDTSRLASRRPEAGGAPNALFLAGDATRLEGLQILKGCVDELRVSLPWGSLARAVLDADPTFMARVAALLRPGGAMGLLISVTDRDGGLGRSALCEADARVLAVDLAADGFAVRFVRGATAEDVSTVASSWAKRLGIPHRRAAWMIELERRVHAGGTRGPHGRV